MNQERKVSMLRNLLARVQERASAPRVAASPQAVGGAMTASGVVVSPAAASPLAISAPPPQPAKTSARPGSSTLPLDYGSSEEAASIRAASTAAAQPPAVQAASTMSNRGPASDPEIEMEEGPPSAPRLREVTEEEAAASDREIEEEEPQLKTPPPESGRQHVTPGPTAVSGPDEDIAITVEESEAPPPIEPSPAPVAPMAASANLRADIAEVNATPPPRLALVSEPEIELHGMTPLSSTAEAIAAGVPAKAPAVPPPTPSGVRPVPAAAPGPPPAPPAPPVQVSPLARTSPSIPDTKPSVSAAAPSAPEAAPPARLMAQPLGEAGKQGPPIEVWASTFAPAALRGQVASFVGHNANFAPKSFAELVRASIALGEDNS